MAMLSHAEAACPAGEAFTAVAEETAPHYSPKMERNSAIAHSKNNLLKFRKTGDIGRKSKIYMGR